MKRFLLLTPYSLLPTPYFYILAFLGSYLVGSIPFAYLVARWAGGIDITQYGSGNVGATNVARAMGWRYGSVVFLMDMLKGLMPVYLASSYVGAVAGPLPTAVYPLAILCGLGAILGHVFPVYLRFQGGKAAATSFGVLIWLAPKALLIAFATWGVTVLITRYVSLGSIMGAVSFCVVMVTLYHEPFGQGLYLTLFSFIIAALVILRHKENISRLLAGTERKIGR
ncbi:MAG TPA: glycerol-3-phosphate 1-O-acyltransferase PlsY [Candidatus Tripitaka californicus]|uniref:glycerol-3-phosphate 1-O-acyltransferase PlsY n=1 Tax=Candidatus Tripitaka californicus TaxID=3367616 RepID=UPI0040264962|nr:glycerol-3-phosphate 1-O-acyltransferase PlsY [Planctomycetota bacterium]